MQQNLLNFLMECMDLCRPDRIKLVKSSRFKVCRRNFPWQTFILVPLWKGIKFVTQTPPLHSQPIHPVIHLWQPMPTFYLLVFKNHSTAPLLLILANIAGGMKNGVTIGHHSNAFGMGLQERIGPPESANNWHFHKSFHFSKEKNVLRFVLYIK